MSNSILKRIFLSPPHMGGEEMRFVKEAFESNYIAPLGPQVDAFEREFIGRARFLSQQAREDFPHYEHTEIGYNYRMSNILAAIGRGQLRVQGLEAGENDPQISQIDADYKKKKKRYKARMVGGEVAEDLFDRGLCLPSGTAMTDGDLDRIIKTILKCQK
jgi:dTDP-4-amino-4,6-dideoxygalactose transaminase